MTYETALAKAKNIGGEISGLTAVAYAILYAGTVIAAAINKQGPRQTLFN